MPVITMQIGPLEEETKKDLIKNLTNEAAKATQINPDFFTVYIQEYPLENVGQGGKTIKEFLSK